MASISRLLCLILALLQSHYGYSKPSHPFSAQNMHQQRPSFETGPIDPPRFPSRESRSSGKLQEPKEMEDLNLKILGNAIGEGIVKAQQEQQYKQPIYEESPTYQKKDSERSSTFHQPHGRRAHKTHHPAATQSQALKEPVAEESEVFQAPLIGRSRAFSETAAERSQMPQDRGAGQYRTFQQPFAQGSQVLQAPMMAGQSQMYIQPSFESPREYRQPFSMPAPPKRARKMKASMSFGLQEGDPIRTSRGVAKGYMRPQAPGMPMQWLPDFMGRN